jgi:phosphate transport system permease protein
VVSEDPHVRGLSPENSGLGTGAPALVDLVDVSRPPTPRSLKSRKSGSDLTFRGILGTGGALVLILEVLVGTFLAIRAWPALHKAGFSFLTTQSWNPEGGAYGIAAVVVGTTLIALVAAVVALPLSLGTALFISEYAPKPLQRLLIGMIDLMAAVPSVVFGLWGSYLLQWRILPDLRWVNDWFYWIPVFQVSGIDRSNPLTSLVATRWGMITSVVLPFGRGAMIGGTMLGLGRALGETMAVLLIISPVYAIQPHILQHGSSSVSSLIASQYSEMNPFGISALMAAGLALFGMTLLVNMAAAQIVSRSRSGAMSEA